MTLFHHLNHDEVRHIRSDKTPTHSISANEMDTENAQSRTRKMVNPMQPFSNLGAVARLELSLLGRGTPNPLARLRFHDSPMARPQFSGVSQAVRRTSANRPTRNLTNCLAQQTRFSAPALRCGNHHDGNYPIDRLQDNSRAEATVLIAFPRRDLRDGRAVSRKISGEATCENSFTTS